MPPCTGWHACSTAEKIPLFIARRLVRLANEDIAMADPQAVHQALAAWDVYERLGSPEGELAIAQAVVYLATAPKSIAVYRGFNAAWQLAKRTGSLMPPAHILNAPRSEEHTSELQSRG